MLVINGQTYTTAGGRFFGNASRYFQGENYLLSMVGMKFSPKAGIPDGYGMTGLLPALKEGGLSSFNGMGGAGVLVASMQLGKDLSASLVGQGVITDASLSLIVSLLADLAGSGDLSASMQGTVQLAADLVGQGDITAALGVIAWCTAVLAGSGGLDGSNLRGTLSMAAAISSTGDLVTAESCAAAVWAKILGTSSTAEAALALIEKVLRNKTITDPAAGTMTVYEADGITPALVADLFEDAAGGVPYRGQGAERREKLE